MTVWSEKYLKRDNDWGTVDTYSLLLCVDTEGAECSGAGYYKKMKEENRYETIR